MLYRQILKTSGKSTHEVFKIYLNIETECKLAGEQHNPKEDIPVVIH
jgi:hypothetical protein